MLAEATITFTEVFQLSQEYYNPTDCGLKEHNSQYQNAGGYCHFQWLAERELIQPVSPQGVSPSPIMLIAIYDI